MQFKKSLGPWLSLMYFVANCTMWSYFKIVVDMVCIPFGTAELSYQQFHLMILILNSKCQFTFWKKKQQNILAIRSFAKFEPIDFEDNFYLSV